MEHNHSHDHDHNHSHGHHDGHDDAHEDDETADRRHFEDVVLSCRFYRRHCAVMIDRLARDFSKLSERHRNILSNYRSKLASMAQAADANQAFLSMLVNNVDLFGKGDQEQHDGQQQHGMAPTSDSLNKAHSTLRQFVRDWADEGQSERDRCYGPILQEVERRFPITKNELNKYSVLVPGCGLARLVWEFAHRGYAVQGNEFSYHMLLGSNWVLNQSGGRHVAAVYPNIMSGGNRVQVADQMMRAMVPNVRTDDLPAGVDMSMNAGEFCAVYNSDDFGEYFDVVAAPFFLDTAHNALDYMDTIWHVLKPGGIWINLGPLLWHYSEQETESQVELTLADVLNCAKQVGFELDVKSPISCTYAADRTAMMQTVYNCAFFVATKPAAQGQKEKEKSKTSV